MSLHLAESQELPLPPLFPHAPLPTPCPSAPPPAPAHPELILLPCHPQHLTEQPVKSSGGGGHVPHCAAGLQMQTALLT